MNAVARVRTWVGSWQPPASWPPWLARAITGGPIVGAIAAGALLWVPSHSIGESLATSILTLVILGGLRIVDPYLVGLWRQLDRIPRVARLAVGMGVTVWFSISRFGPSAAGKEVSTMRTTLLITMVCGFVILHPKAAE